VIEVSSRACVCVGRRAAKCDDFTQQSTGNRSSGTPSDLESIGMILINC
jgi:hypothetical protein